MIAMNAAQHLRDAIAEQIGIREAGEGVFVVDVPWSYPDGDQCRVFVSKSKDGQWNVTDGGSSVMRASYADDVDVMDRGYVERFKQIVTLNGLAEDEGELMASAVTDIGRAVFAVAQASVDVVHLSRLPQERARAAQYRAQLNQAQQENDALRRGNPAWT